MAKAELEELLVTEPAEWRAWLEQHHDTSPGVWLVLGKKGGTVTTMTHTTALDEALCFGWIDGQARSRDAETSLQRMTRRGPRSRWSARNVGHIERLEGESKMRPAGRAAVDAAKADGRWEEAYAGPATAVVPDDLAAAIAANPDAQAMLEVLTSTNRFALINRLGAVKRAETRERKIREFVEMLARGETPYPQKRAADEALDRPPRALCPRSQNACSARSGVTQSCGSAHGVRPFDLGKRGFVWPTGLQAVSKQQPWVRRVLPAHGTPPAVNQTGRSGGPTSTRGPWCTTPARSRRASRSG